MWQSSSTGNDTANQDWLDSCHPAIVSMINKQTVTLPCDTTLCFVLIWVRCFGAYEQSLGFCIILTYFTPWIRVLWENRTGFQIVNNFPAFYETQTFITAFTRSRHLYLIWASSIQSMTPPPITLPEDPLNTVLPSKPGSSNWSLSLRFPHQNSVCTSPLPHKWYTIIIIIICS